MPPGTLPEGYEARIRMQAEVVRVVTDDGNTKVAFNFAYELNKYLRFNKWLRLVATSILFIIISVFTVLYMRQKVSSTLCSTSQFFFMVLLHQHFSLADSFLPSFIEILQS